MSRYFFVTSFCFLFLLGGYAQVSVTILSEGLAAKKMANGKNTLYGFVNGRGKVKISAQFDTVYAPFKNGMAAVGLNGKAGVINKKGKVILPFEFKEIGEVSRFSIAVKNEKGLWGFYNHKGEKNQEPLFQNFRYAGKNKIIVQQNGKWGLINDKGNILIEFKYKWVDHVSDRHFRTWNMPVWSVISKDNKVLFAGAYDNLKYSGDGLYVYSVIGKKGLLSKDGSLISNAVYEEIGNFKHGLVKAKKEKYGVLDVTNKFIIPFLYDDLIIDSLYIRVMKKIRGDDGEVTEKWGLFDHRGNELIKPKYAYLNEYSEGLIAAKREEKTWGYIDPLGNTMILFRYSLAGDFKSGTADVLIPYSSIQKDLPAVIDKKGEYVVTPVNYDFYKLGLIDIRFDKASFNIAKDKYQHYERIDENYIRVGKDGLWGMILSNGKEIIPPVYEKVSDPSEQGLIVVIKDGKSGVVDSKGNFTFKLSSRFEYIEGYHEGFSKFLLKSKYGFIDRYGNVYISPQYPEAGIMSDSMVNVRLRGKWAFVDYKENLKVQPYYEEVKPFINGAALVKEDGLWNIVNKEGRELHINDFQKIERIFTGRYLLYSQNKMGMADQNGREILAPKYEGLKDTGNGYVLVNKNGYWGVLDYQENFVLPFDYESVSYVAETNVFITHTDKKQQDVFIK